MRVPLFTGICLWGLLCALPAAPHNEREYQHGYRFFQNGAPEFFQIEVLEVSATPSKGFFGGTKTHIKASARIIDVIRSDTGAQNGEIIELRYDHAPKAGNSAETPPLIESGKSYPAFLKRTGKTFIPIARHLSFSPPSGVQMKVYEEARTRSREKALLAANTPATPSVPIPVVEPSPLPATPQPVATPAAPVEPTPAENPPPAPEPTKVKPPRAPRQTQTAATTPKSESEFPSANVESQPLPTKEDAPMVETTVEAPTPKPAPVARLTPPVTPPQPSAPKTPPDTATPVVVNPMEEPLPQIPVEPAPTPMASPDPQPVSKPSTEGATARKGYAEIYGLIKEGETAQFEGKDDKARSIYTQAREKLLVLKTEQPEFQPFMVQYRLRDLEKKLDMLAAPSQEKSKP